MAITATRKWLVDDLPLIIDSLSQQRQREEEEPLQPPGSRRFMCRPGGDRLSLTATDAAHARSSSAAQTVRCAVAHLHIPNFHPSAQCCHSFDSIHFSENFSFEKIKKMDADPLTADSPLSMSSATSMAVESTGLKLSKEEEDYLEKLMAEKKTVDQTAALDLTQKLLNAGICPSLQLFFRGVANGRRQVEPPT